MVSVNTALVHSLKSTGKTEDSCRLNNFEQYRFRIAKAKLLYSDFYPLTLNDHSTNWSIFFAYIAHRE